MSEEKQTISLSEALKLQANKPPLRRLGEKVRLKKVLDIPENTSALFKSKQIPAGGDTGAVLKKVSDENYYVEWEKISIEDIQTPEGPHENRFFRRDGQFVVVPGTEGATMEFGSRFTGVHAGTVGEMTHDDDFLYICVEGGDVGIARWKRIPLRLV